MLYPHGLKDMAKKLVEFSPTKTYLYFKGARIGTTATIRTIQRFNCVRLWNSADALWIAGDNINLYYETLVLHCFESHLSGYYYEG